MAHIRVNVTLAPEDLERLDRLAAETGRSRSELIREAVRAYRPAAERPGARPDPATVLQWLDTVRVTLPADSTTLIRAMREGRHG